MIEALRKDGFFVQPDFITQAEVGELQADLARRFDSGLFRDAGVGALGTRKNEIRGDQIHWLTSGEPSLLAKRFENLRTQLNRNLFLGLERLEGHYARYPAGGFYLRHIDNQQRKDSRVVSVILYLNRDWSPGDGGELILHLETGPRKVEPLAGTLVAFLARELEHEVSLCHRPRLSYTGWYHCSSGPSPL